VFSNSFGNTNEITHLYFTHFMSKIKGVSGKFHTLWQAAERLLEQAEPREVAHTEDMIRAVLECRKVIKFDLDIFLSLAILHNIERIIVLKKYFGDIVVTAKLKNGKMVRLSAAENTVKYLAESVGITPEKVEEIISVLKVRQKARGVDHTEDRKKNKLYNTDNKKLFHDLHLLSRFNRKEVKRIKKTISGKDEFMDIINTRLGLFFNNEIKKIAEDKFREIEGLRKQPRWSDN